MISRRTNQVPLTISAGQKIRIAELWRERKLNTYEISVLTHIPEHEVANLIHEWRERRRAARAA